MIELRPLVTAPLVTAPLVTAMTLRPRLAIA
jgi:hypothetical protein